MQIVLSGDSVCERVCTLGRRGKRGKRGLLNGGLDKQASATLMD